jgi:hypothetical protein
MTSVPTITASEPGHTAGEVVSPVGSGSSRGKQAWLAKP